jgi:hypothetical protein
MAEKPKAAGKYPIEKNVPIPYAKIEGSRFPFAEMAVGDSVFIPGPKRVFTSSLARVRYAKGYRFTTRTVDGGIRVWRIG